MLSKYISCKLFIISFAIGLFVVYMLGPNKKTIYIYPTPDNYKDVLYEDNAGQCFMFTPTETTKPLNPFDIKSIPLQ